MNTKIIVILWEKINYVEIFEVKKKKKEVNSTIDNNKLYKRNT